MHNQKKETAVMMVETGGWGGIGHYAHCLAEALQHNRASVRLVTHLNNYQLDGFSKHYTVEQTFVGDGFIADWKRLYQAWQGEPVIHFQSLLSTRRDWIAFYALKLCMPNVKRIVTVHNVLPHEVATGEIFAYRRLYRIADGLVVHSEASRKRLYGLMGKGFDTPVAVVPMGHFGVVTGKCLPSRHEAMGVLSLDGSYRYMVCFGAIRPYKGIDLLMKAVAQVESWPADMKVLVIGHLLTGVSEEELVSLRKELGLEDRVTFNFNYVPEEHIPHVFAVTDISLLPYRHIDQSGVLMAAMAAGTPVLCTPVGAFPEVLNKSFGFLAQGVSISEMAEVLKLALAQKDDWPVMGIEAKRVALRKYGWDHIAEKTLQFYAQVKDS